MPEGKGTLPGTGDADCGMLHVIAQEFEHGDAFIVGTPVALRHLMAAIDAALSDGVAAVERGTVPKDGEGFWLTVHAVPPEGMAGVPLPYAEMRDGTEIPEWLDQAQEKAVVALLERRKGGGKDMPETGTKAAGTREWLVVGSIGANSAFAPEAGRLPRGHIPRDVAEQLLGRDLGGAVRFTEADGAALRGHPDWREGPPGGGEARPGRADGFYWVRFGSRSPEVSEWTGDGWHRTGDERIQPDGCAVLSGRLGEPAPTSAATGETALEARLLAMTACDRECGGRCAECPDDPMREAAARISALEREVAALRERTVLPPAGPWVRTVDRLPGKPGKDSYEHVDCAIFRKGEILCRPWNCEHLCWDDEDRDDFFCDALEPTHWMRLEAP